MFEATEPSGKTPATATTHADGLPTGGQSITGARALSAPATVDRAARTVEVVWSTGARARNYVPPLGLITEELDMSPNAVRMHGLRGGGAPVLNTHRSGDARDVVGRVIAARLEAGRGIATLQFSSATDVEPLWQRIADGTLRSVSVGYRVHRYEPIPDPISGTVHRAVDWEPYEISVVPLPVDPAAAVRGASDAPPLPAVEPAIADPTPIRTQETTMPEPADAATTTSTAPQETNLTMTTAPAAPPAPAVTPPVPPNSRRCCQTTPAGSTPTAPSPGARPKTSSAPAVASRGRWGQVSGVAPRRSPGCGRTTRPCAGFAAASRRSSAPGSGHMACAACAGSGWPRPACRSASPPWPTTCAARLPCCTPPRDAGRLCSQHNKRRNARRDRVNMDAHGTRGIAMPRDTEPEGLKRASAHRSHK